MFHSGSGAGEIPGTSHSRNNYYIFNSWRGPDGNCNPILILRRRHDCTCNSKLIHQKGPAVTVISFSFSCFSFLPFLAARQFPFTFALTFTYIFTNGRWHVQAYKRRYEEKEDDRQETKLGG